MEVIRRWIKDAAGFIGNTPLTIYIHAVMVVLAAQNVSFYFEPLPANLKIPFLYWIVCAYFFVFLIFFLRDDKRDWFFVTVILVGAFILYLMVKSDVEYVPGTPVKLNFWPITVFFCGFVAWPVLALPFYLYSLGYSWKLVLLLYAAVFAAGYLIRRFLLKRRK